MTRLAVLGTGRIGGEAAYVSSILGIIDELVVYDTAHDLLNAQVLDLVQTGLDIPISSDTRLVKQADICIFAAGLPRDPTVKTRADLLGANIPVLNTCMNLLHGFSGVLITVTNPMDVNNYYLSIKAGLDRERCIGFGGQLDSARFGVALREKGISGTPWILGEHGDYQVPVFSRLPGTTSIPLREEILTGLKASSMQIIKGKGGTVFGPAYHIAMLVNAIATDSRDLLACSAILDGEYGMKDCSLGVPVKVGKNGICSIEEWDLDAWEQEKLGAAARFVGELCKTAVG